MTPLDRFIYISGPISDGSKLDSSQIGVNVINGENIYMALVEKGWNPICPHFSHYPQERLGKHIDWETWIATDENYVKGCPTLFYMLPRIYGASKGALHEYKLAQKLGKVIYTSLSDVPNLNKKQVVPAL